MSNRTEPIRSVKGTRDLLPRETALWQRVEDEARRVFAAYNFREIRTPILEQTALFARSVGADTDIVTKEMYTFEDRPAELPDPFETYDFPGFVKKLERAFESGSIPRHAANAELISELRAKFDAFERLYLKDRGTSIDDTLILKTLAFSNETYGLLRSLQLGESLTLRPEATASVVRAYIEHAMSNEGGIHKLYYIGPMFRRERPQKGRYRQFNQIGAEVLGSDNPTIDAEFLEMLALLLTRVGLTEYKLLLNSVGCPKCRPAFVEVLRQALEQVKDQMCDDCQRRTVTNPLRVLDCKVEADQPIIEKLPHIIDY
ncbi:MAG: ATP phosphoribosyltransferase regulatory subunit, partial [Candidatus Binataceae bacterium]